MNTIVISCYDPKSDTVFLAVLAKNADPNIWYKIFDCNTNTFISTENTIPNSVFAQTTPICLYNPTSNSIFLIWPGRYGEPRYAIYDCAGGTFSTPATKLLADNSLAGSFVSHQYSPKSNKSFISWCDETNTPYYIVFDHSFSPVAQTPIKVPNSESFECNFFNGCYNSKFNQTFICAQASNSETIYALFDFNSGAFTGTPKQVVI